MKLKAERAAPPATGDRRSAWRSLEELAEAQDFDRLLRSRFPRQAAALEGGLSRREFLKLTAASLALAGLTACVSPPREEIVPYVRRPEAIVPGRPLFFATAMPLSGYATGLLVESHEGRPTKVEGNPDHPDSLGATSALAQASVLGLYDPDRSQALRFQGRIRPWDEFLRDVEAALNEQRAKGGAGLRVLSESISSPTLVDQLTRLLNAFPRARWHSYEPVNRDNARAGALLALGEVVETRYQFEQAEIIVALDSDFVSGGPGALRYAREFAARRRVRAGPVPDSVTRGQAPDSVTRGQAGMNRLYVVESSATAAGAIADHRLPLRPSEIEAFTRALAARLGVESGESPAPESLPAREAWLDPLARDLLAHRGASLLLAGDGQPPAVHALVHAMNAALGNVGRTVLYTDPVVAGPASQTQSLGELVHDMQAGQVEMLLILGGNPAYTAPADIPFASLLPAVRLSVHLSLYEDETSALCQWHVPETHYLEMWSDARAFDGTVSLIQPLIAPLYGGRSAHELLAVFGGQPAASGYDLVRAYWQSQNQTDDFEQRWRTALHDGIMPGTTLPEKEVSLRADGLGLPPAPPSDSAALEIIFRPDPSVYDGRFANNGWLQELPRPLTGLTWDNAALLSPATAERLGLAAEDVIELRYAQRVVRAPVWVLPGHADEAVTVHLGYGRARAGSVGTGLGFSAYALRTSGAPWFDPGLEIQKAGRTYSLATTQSHHQIEGRNLIRMATLAEYQANPGFAQEAGGEVDPGTESLYPEYSYEGNRWGMAIDLSACMGCNACVVACQAENNIPVVGKDQVLNSREMHWLRVDSYFVGEPENPKTCFQPVPCMHCEKAPCEVVCPVTATVHSQDGLNDMVYNRCVGTRYCSNNCPYKVRRFNFLQYADYDAPGLALLANPQVTVRTRGVMEKCTYCVQRIRAGQAEAEKDGRRVRDGEVVTACQAACPTQAIVFGDMNDPESGVAALKAEPLNYALLAELNTQPRTTYLAALRNPNPEMETG